MKSKEQLAHEYATVGNGLVNGGQERAFIVGWDTCTTHALQACSEFDERRAASAAEFAIVMENDIHRPRAAVFVDGARWQYSILAKQLGVFKLEWLNECDRNTQLQAQVRELELQVAELKKTHALFGGLEKIEIHKLEEKN